MSGDGLDWVSANGHRSAAAGLTTPWVGAAGSRWAVAARVLLLLPMLLVGTMLWRDFASEGSAASRAVHPATRHPATRMRRGLSSLPPAAQGVVSAALGSESRAYRIGRLGDGYEAVNPAQRLRARFDRAGVQVQSAGAQLGLRLDAAGYGTSPATLAPAVPRARGNRVVYTHAGLSEWYANGPLGLEQGFGVARAPAGEAGLAGVAGVPLVLSLALSGNVRASVDPGGRGLTLAAPGRSSLRYDNLLATDAQGRALHSWITLQAGRVLLHVDTRGARYPLNIDPVIQQGNTLTQQGPKLTGKEEIGEAELGLSVALSSNGNTALIGGTIDNTRVGAAWVFTRSEGKWTQQGTKLTGKEEVEEAWFGDSVALSSDGNTALIGGIGDNKYAGAAWVFTSSEGKWTQQGTKLTGKEEVGEAHFGTSVALSSEGNTALVGGPEDNKRVGAVWVFTRSEGKWKQQGAKLTGGKEEVEGGWFGDSVALASNGSTALIGGPNDNNAVGAAWVFVTSPKLTGGTEETGKGYFGFSVALSASGTTALVGAPKDNKEVGAAWVFTSSGGKWTQQGTKLTGKEETGAGEFGYSVALSPNGGIALIGGPRDNENHGAAWVFTRSEGKWTQQTKLTGKEATGTAEFGSSVALSSEGNTALIGGPFDNNGHGAAWVFTSSEGKWTQQTKLTGKEEIGEIVLFGGSVALSSNGNTALIGGVDDNESHGAAWMFTRSEGKWTQQTKLTGKEESGEKILFGDSVALSSEGNTALIGGGEDNKTVGAAWVFTLSGGKWTQQGGKITGKEEAGTAEFGDSVALASNGNTALIGGLLDSESAAGAAWVFARSEGKWTQQGPKLAGNEEIGGGAFGSSVALSSEASAALIGGESDNSGAGAAWTFVSPVMATKIAEETSPATVINPSNSEQWVVYADGEHELAYWHNSTSTKGWVNGVIGGSVKAGTSPTAVINSSGAVFVYYVNTSGEVVERTLSEEKWVEHVLGGKVASGSSPYAVTKPSTNNQYVFYVNSSNEIADFTYNGEWTGPSTVGGKVKSGSSPTATVWSGGNEFVYYVNTSGEITNWTFSEGKWIGPTAFGGKVAANSSPSVVTNPSTSWQYVVYVNSSNEIADFIWDGEWTGPSTVGGKVKSGTSPTVSVWSTGEAFVFYVNTSDEVANWTLSEGKWVGRPFGGEVMAGSTPASEQFGSSQLYIFYAGAYQETNEFAYDAGWSGPSTLPF